MQEKQKSLELGFVEKIDAENKIITACVSSEIVDRCGDIVSAAALAAAVKGFAKNPIMCAVHLRRTDSGKPTVIGSWLTDTFKQSGKKSYMDCQFASTQLAEEYWQLYRDKHMRAFSISFWPLEFHDEKTVKGGLIRVYDKIELIEISACAVGCNPDALSKELDSLFEGKITDLQKQITHLTEEVEMLKDLSCDRQEFADKLLSSGNNPTGSDAQQDAAHIDRLAEKLDRLNKGLTG